jgi:ectoine hydroxylase-related dioxygenase (phytanoyl-CoA dioxygenase family)
VPHDAWHIDFPATSPMPALRAFAFLSDVAPGGGGTVVVTGSHRLVGDLPDTRSVTVRARLGERSDWFRALWRKHADGDRVARFMDAGAIVDGVEVRVVVLTGRPGDVVLWHPALLHGIAPNCADRPRFMLTHTVWRGPAAPGQGVTRNAG